VDIRRDGHRFLETLGDLDAVDERPAERPAVANEILAVAAQNLGVVPRDVGAGELEIAGPTPADGERRLVENHDSPALAVGDLEPRICHGRHLVVRTSNNSLAAPLAGPAGSRAKACHNP